MDFSAKRLALLAGVGDSEDRHEIVREYAQQLNESAEARQLNEDEEAVRKAVRRTIQKMIAEGSIDVQEEMHEEVVAEEVVNEEEDQEAPSDEDLERMRKSLEAAEAEAKRREEEKAKQKASQNESINEADATLMRLQKLAGIQILSEGYTDDNLTEGYSDDELRELCHSKDHNCAVVVEHPEWGRGKPLYESHALPDDEGNVEWYDVQFKHGIEKKVMAEDVTILEMEEHMHNEEEDDDVDESHCSEGEHMEEGEHDEAKLYELEDGRMYMEMGGKRYMMQEMEEELNELDEELEDLPDDAMLDTETGQVVVPHDKQAE